MAEIIASPLEAIIGTESEVGPPGPEIIPPCANFFPIAPGIIIPGFALAKFIDAVPAEEYAAISFCIDAASAVNVCVSVACV